MQNQSVPPRIDFHEGTLRCFGIEYKCLCKVAPTVPFVWDERDDCFRTDAMHAVDLRRALDQLFAGDYQWCVVAADDEGVRLNDRRSLNLRSDQQDATDAFASSGHRGLIVMPTGTGKTMVALELMIRYQCSTLVVVPVRDLMYQWHTKILEATGVDAGIIGDGVHRVSPVSVTTYDSAAIHMHRIGCRFRMIVFDEVHHLAGRWRSDAARMSPAEFRLGITATLPIDSKRLATLEQLVGPVCYRQSIVEASGETLADYRVQRITVELDDSERERYRALSERIQRFVRDQHASDPDFRWEEAYGLSAETKRMPRRAHDAMLALRAFRQKRYIEEHASAKMKILEDLFRLHSDEPVIVFTGSNVMARMISTHYMVPCILSHCGKKERRQWLEGFANGRYPVLVANRVLDEGVDLPHVKTAIVLGGLSSQRQAIQRLGRVLRRSTAGRSATLYEVVVNKTREVNRSRDRRRNEAFRRPS